MALVRSVKELAARPAVCGAAGPLSGPSRVVPVEVLRICLSHRLLHLVVEQVDLLHTPLGHLALSLGLPSVSEGLRACFAPSEVTGAGLWGLEERLLALGVLRLI